MLKLVIAEANRVLIPSDKFDAVTTDELQSAADDLQMTIESVVSAGLSKSHPLVKEAAQLDTLLWDEGSKRRVSVVLKTITKGF